MASDGAVISCRPRSLTAARFGCDVVTVFIGWVVLGYLFTEAMTPVGRLVPGMSAAAITLGATQLAGLYRAPRCNQRSAVVLGLAAANLCGALEFVIVQWSMWSPGSEAVICAAASLALTGAGRWLFAGWLRALRARGFHLRRVLLVGGNDDAAALQTMLAAEPELGFAVAGTIGHGLARGDKGLPHAASLDDMAALAAGAGASGVIIVPYGLSRDTTRSALALATQAGLDVQVWPGLPGVGSRRLRQVPVSGEVFFHIEPQSPSRCGLAVKRLIDIVGATVGLACAAPAIGLAALLIKLEDGGPVLHRCERIGLHGATFRTYKLRSMVTEHRQGAFDLTTLNERTDGPLFKASRDPRITRVGHFLRSSSIDELPQLWNVLRGDMSLVGPRPALPDEVAQFDKEFQRRHSVRPGMTGLWQVEARHNPSFHAYRRLDLRYVDNWSLSLDLGILLATIPSVASQAVHALRARTAGADSPGGPMPADTPSIGASVAGAAAAEEPKPRPPESYAPAGLPQTA